MINRFTDMDLQTIVSTLLPMRLDYGFNETEQKFIDDLIENNDSEFRAELKRQFGKNAIVLRDENTLDILTRHSIRIMIDNLKRR